MEWLPALIDDSIIKYLIDFGITRVFHPGKAKDTTPLGSPGYAAPEQYGRGQSDPRTDIYALGATLQTLLTGRDPLELRAGEPSRSPHPIPLFVQQMLAAMMKPDPGHRPATMRTVKKDLEKALAKVRWVPSYILGMGLGLGACFLPFLMLGYCGGALTFPGIIILLAYLFSRPLTRPMAWGILTLVLLLIIVLFVFSTLNF